MAQEEFLIEAAALKSMLGKQDVRLYDATIIFAMGLSPEEAAKMPTAHEKYLAGHIPGAAFFDHEKFSDMESSYEYIVANDEVLEAAIGAVGIGNESEVIVYDSNGLLATATRAWWLLRYAGVKNVRILNGGLAAWQEAGGEVETKEDSYPATAFKASFTPSMFASKEEVQAANEDAAVRVENALMHDWYDQEHIPNSVCLPMTEILQGWSSFLSEDVIKEKMNKSEKSARIITYCGGGIAATVNAVGYLMLGNDNVGIYDGSLYEWKGEGLPLASNK